MNQDEFLWDNIKHEDQMFTDRGNFFLVAEGMLLAAVTAFGDHSAHRFTQAFACLSGIVVALIWFRVNWVHIFRTQRPLKKKFEKVAPELAEIMRAERPKTRYVPNHVLMGLVLPASLLVVWVVFLLQ
jgi:hypothetical protein